MHQATRALVSIHLSPVLQLRRVLSVCGIFRYLVGFIRHDVDFWGRICTATYKVMCSGFTCPFFHYNITIINFINNLNAHHHLRQLDWSAILPPHFIYVIIHYSYPLFCFISLYINYLGNLFSHYSPFLHVFERMVIIFRDLFSIVE